MDNVNYSPKMLPRLVNDRVFASDPFTLIDIGCAMGIDTLWRLFGDDLRAHAFDPQVEECAKLTAQEKNDHVQYHAAFVGLPPDHAFHKGRQTTPRWPTYFDPGSQFARSSSLAAGRRRAAPTAGASSVESTEQWEKVQLAPRTIPISEFAAEQNLSSIDFVKIDTDGRDLEAANSCRDIIRSANILGFMVECFFAGSNDPTENSFRNVDEFMRENGFALYSMSAYKYSREALPAPFVYAALYQTVSGQTVWGDMIYLRDGGAPNYATFWGGELSTTKLLKLVCLYELLNLPDCAAELILIHRDRIQTVIDPTILLDLLTPKLGGVDRTYKEYVELFEQRPEAFFPQP
jgi:FkbM family methyltransferase